MKRLKSASSFSKNLAALREKSGLTQESLAAKARVSQGAVSAYEAGKRWPTKAAAYCLARALGVTVEALLGRDT